MKGSGQETGIHLRAYETGGNGGIQKGVTETEA